MQEVSSIQQIILKWNTIYPQDKKYRKKYSIPFNSKLHRETSQIDISIEMYEDVLFEYYGWKHAEQNMYNKQYDKGKLWKHKKIDEKAINELFDKIEI